MCGLVLKLEINIIRKSLQSSRDGFDSQSQLSFPLASTMLSQGEA